MLPSERCRAIGERRDLPLADRLGRCPQLGPRAREPERLGHPEIEEHARTLDLALDRRVRLLRARHLVRVAVEEAVQRLHRLGCAPHLFHDEHGGERRVRLHELLGTCDADQRVPHTHVVIEVRERESRHERREPEGDLRDLRPHGRQVDAVDAPAQDQPFEEHGVVDADPVRGPGTSAQVVELPRHVWQRVLAEEAGDPVGQLVHDCDEEVRAAAGGVEHVEREELPGRVGRLLAGERGDRLEVALERGQHPAAHEVPDERLRGVVDAAALPPAFVGEPEELAGLVLRVVTFGGHVALAARVVAVGAVGEGEP